METSKVTAQRKALEAITSSLYGQDQTEDYWRNVIDIVRPAILEQAAMTVEAEADREPRGWREKVARSSWLESRMWLRFAAGLVRGLK